MAFDTTAAGLRPSSNIVAAGINQGRFAQVGGLRFSWDPDLAAGSPHPERRPGRRAAPVVIARLVENGVAVAGAPSVISVLDHQLHGQRRRWLSHQGQWQQLPLPAGRRHALAPRSTRRSTSRRQPTFPPMRWASRRPSPTSCRPSTARWPPAFDTADTAESLDTADPEPQRAQRRRVRRARSAWRTWPTHAPRRRRRYRHGNGRPRHAGRRRRQRHGERRRRGRQYRPWPGRGCPARHPE